MAVITLGNLRDYWKRVNDWVSGVTTDAPKVTLSGSNIIVAIEDTATSLVTQAAFQVRQIVAVHNDGSDNLFVSFNGNTWLRIPAGKSALENALLSATTLYYKANSPVPFRAWGVM